MTKKDWLRIEGTGYPHDSDFPWIAVNAEGEMVARFVNALTARLFVTQVLENWGRYAKTEAEN